MGRAAGGAVTSSPGEATEVAPGIFQLAVPTPLPVGPVNAYLLVGEPLALVDGGPGLASAYLDLEELLRRTGHSVEELEVLVLTHHHVDHEGLTRLLAERSGARVIARGDTADYVQDFDRSQAHTDRFRRHLLAQHGFERPVVDAFGGLTAMYGTLGSAVAVSHRVEDGDTVVLGGAEYAVLHRPGHSPTDTVFHDPRRGILIAGDHLLPNISANALISPAGQAGEATRPLLDYRRSLLATRACDVDLVLGGHGPAVRGHAALIDHRLREHRQRAEQLHGHLLERPMTARELAEALWGPLDFRNAYLTLSEVLGHLDLLLEEGRIRVHDLDGVPSFEPVR